MQCKGAMPPTIAPFVALFLRMLGSAKCKFII